MKNWRLLSAGVFCLVSFATSMFCQSVLNLPRLVEENGRFTGIAIANPSNWTASIRYQLYDETGNPIAVSSKTAVTKIAPGGQFTQFANQLFSIQPNFRGWAQVISDDNTNLRGFYLMGDDAVTLLDGADGAQAYREQVLPFLANDSTTSTEINIVNPNDSTAYVSMTAIDFDGTVSPGGVAGLTLQPHAVFRLSTREIFSNSTYPNASYYSIVSNVGVLAMEVVEDLAQPETACLNGVDVNAAGRVLNFPHAVLGGDYFSVLGVINLLDIQQTVQISLYQPDGILMNTGSIPNPLSITLNSKASLRKSLVDLFQLSSSLDSLMSGWVQVESSFGPISGFIAYGNLSTPSLAAVEPQLQPMNAMVFSHMAPQSLGYFTGIALLNINPTTASVKLSAIDPNGVTTSVRQISLSPQQKIAQLVSDLLPEANDQVGGSVVIVSDQPLFGIELFGSTNLRVLANVPADGVSSIYTPPDLGKFVISGRVAQVTGSPIPNATVQLSGSLPGTSVLTDDQGEYVFLNVPSGNYAIEPSLENYDFAPGALSVSVINQSVGDVDFQANQLPNLAITSLSSSSGPVGSPVTLRGTGFSAVAAENHVHFWGMFTSATVLKNPPPTGNAITVLVPASAQTGPVTVSVGNFLSNPVQFSVTESNPTAVSLPSAVPTSVAISGLGNLALVGHSEAGTISLVNLSPGPSFAQDVSFGKVAGGAVVAVATDDDGTGGGTTRDDFVGFFNIGAIALKAMQLKVARIGAKVARPEMLQSPPYLTAADVNFIALPSGSQPVSLAFQPFGSFAMTANRGTDSVSFFEFPTKANPVLRGNLKLTSGSKPVSVSVSANGLRALVANSGMNSVSVIEFAPTGSGFLMGGVQPVVTRNYLLNSSPTGVAINLDSSLAVTANVDNTASILNLNAAADSSAITTVTLPVFSPGKPSAVNVAIAPNGGYAIVTSSDASGNAYLNVLSLQGSPEVAFVQVLPNGSGASSVAIGPNSSSILVPNPLLGNLAVFNPIPGDVSLETLSLSRAQVKQRLTLYGTGFSGDLKNNVVRFHGKDQSNIVASILAMPSANELTVEVPVDAVSGPVTVNVGPAYSNEQFFVVVPDVSTNPVPSLHSVQPGLISRLRDSTLTLTGVGFCLQSVVEVDLGDGNGPQPLTSIFPGASLTFIDSTRLQVFVPSNNLAGVPNQLVLDVLNPPPGGGRSQGLPLAIIGGPGEPLPNP
jgi:hypothetical protein